jgi:hypothetical protein
MRAAPGRIPKTLPDAATSVSMIQREVLDRPDTRLTDMSIGQLVLSLSDGTPAYLTGSNVWFRAVFGGVPGCTGVCRRRIDKRRFGSMHCLCSQLDYDVVFAAKDAAERFIKGCLSLLNARLPSGTEFTRTDNSFGNGRIVHPDGSAIIDAWHLEEGESIAELLLGYPEPYQRAAIQLGWTIGPGSLTQVVQTSRQRDLLIARHESNYPGRR